MSIDTSMIRYYIGNASDLHDMSRVEIEKSSYGDRYEAEEAAAYLDSDLPWKELLVEMIHEVNLGDYPNE